MSYTRADVRALLHDLDRFVRDVDCGTAGDDTEIAARSSNLQARGDKAEAWVDAAIAADDVLGLIDSYILGSERRGLNTDVLSELREKVKCLREEK